ncbi:MAG: hypothetical protein H6821_12140 [Planctomycetaceae bacterium]|nr:hypothetical protein [Planctomycetaceae bacterium]
MGVFYALDKIMNAFDDRDTEEITLRDRLATQNRITLQGKKADREMRDWRDRSSLL